MIGGGWAWLTVRHDQVATIGLHGLVLRDEQLTPYHDDEAMLRIVRDLLDQQIIDALGRKVVRVTDLTFEIARVDDHDELRVVDVDIGLRSVFRRITQGLLPPTWVRMAQRPIAPRSIPWAACNMIEPDPQRRVRLNITYRFLEDMHPADIADIVEDLGPDDRESILASIDEEVAAETLSEVDPDLQAGILESLEPEKAAEIVQEMEPDQAADVLGGLGEDAVTDILEGMDPASQSEVRELMEYDPDRAGGLMTTDYVAFLPSTTVGEALARLRTLEEPPEDLNAVLLQDAEHRFVGIVPMFRLVTADPAASLESRAGDVAPHVTPEERKDRIIELFDKYNLLTLPVIDERAQVLGVITADDIISVLRGR